MKSLFYLTMFYLAACFLSGCQPAPKNSCEFSKAEAEKILGVSVVQLDKTAPQLGLEGLALTHPQFRACGFVVEKDKSDPPYLYWYNSEFNDAEQSKKFFEETFKNNPRNKESASYENISGIGNDALLYQDIFEDRRETGILVRKGRNVIYIKKGVGKNTAISVEEIKSLAKKISLNTSD